MEHATPESKGSLELVPHTPEGPPPGPPGHPPPPPRHDAAVIIYSDGMAVQKLIERLHKHPDVIEWEDDSILVKTIKRLTICSTKLVSVGSFIGDMTNLTHVNLAFNRIAEVSALAMCPNLVSIDISHNRISAIESIRDLKDLKVLRCHHNHIMSLEPIVELTKLEEFWISYNNLQWTEFIHLLPQINLRSIVKSNNPGNEKKLMNEFLHAICPDLKFIDGVDTRSHFGHASAREFLRSTDGKIMFSQALIQLPAHIKKIIQESEGDKARLRTEYAGASDLPQDIHDDEVLQNENMTVVGTRNQRATEHGHEQGFRRGRKDLLRSSKEGRPMDKDGGSYRSAHDEQALNSAKGDHLILRSALIAEANAHSQVKDKVDEGHAAGNAGVRKQGLGKKMHLREVRGSGYGQQKTGQKVKLYKARKNEYSTEYGGKESDKIDDVLPRDGDSNGRQSSVASHKQGPLKSPSQSLPKHLIRHGSGASTDTVALCLYADGTGYARYAHNNAHTVSIEISANTGKQKLLAYYRSGSLAVTLDGDGNGSVMDSKGKCVCLFTVQEHAHGVAKILHPKTGTMLAQYTKPPDSRTNRGYEGNAIDYGGQSGSAEAGSNVVLSGSQSNVSLLTDEGDSRGELSAKEQEPTSAPKEELPEPDSIQQKSQMSSNTDNSRRKHVWKFEGLQVTFIPSTWELKVAIDNDKVHAEFSTLSGGRLIKARGVDEVATMALSPMQTDNTSVVSHASGASGGSGTSRASRATLSSKVSGQSTGRGGMSDGPGHRSDQALSRVSQELLGGAHVGMEQKHHARVPKMKNYLKSNMTEQDHTAIRENVEEVISNLDSLLGDLKSNETIKKGGK